MALYYNLPIYKETRDFDGVIDEVKIYNRALTDEEIIGQAKITWF